MVVAYIKSNAPLGEFLLETGKQAFYTLCPCLSICRIVDDILELEVDVIYF